MTERMTDVTSGISDAARAELLDRASERGYVLASELTAIEAPLANAHLGDEAGELGITVVDDRGDPEEQVIPIGLSNDPVRQYLNEASRYPLLDFEQEQDLTKRYQAGLAARRMTAARPQREEDPRTRRLVVMGERAKDQLIRSNLRLVVPTARRYAGNDLPMIEAIQEGNLGLIRAVEKFDHTKGYKFSTYAVWWIRQAIQRGLSRRGRTIRVPGTIWEDSGKTRRAEAQLRTDLGRDPSDEEVAEATGLKVSRVREIRTALRPLTSLDLPVGENADLRLGDLVPDVEATDPSRESTIADLRARLVEALGALPERERSILELRFGLRDGETRSLKEVGEIVGLTRERVRQLEKTALASLRDPAARSGLRDMIEVLAA